MFQKFLSVIFCLVFSFGGFCAQRATTGEDFQSYARAADFYFDVQGSGRDVRISIAKGGASIFDRRITSEEYETFADVSRDGISLCRNQDKMLCQVHQRSTGVFFSFLFNLAGDLELSTGGSSDTGIDCRVKFAFKTNGSIANNNPIAFHSLAVSCRNFYNRSILKLNSYDLFAEYLYNVGVIDSKSDRANVALNLEQYAELGLLQPSPPEPTHRANTFDNFGALLGNDLQALGGLSVNSVGTFNAQNLFVEKGSVSAGRYFDVSDTLTGNVDSLIVGAETFANFGQIQTGPMQRLSVNGALRVEKSSSLDAKLFENAGKITAEQSLRILTDEIRNGKGVVLAKDALEVVKRSKESVKERIREGEEAKIELGNLLGKTIKIQHHTDHYLNTITDHYNVDQFGRRTFSHRTETGYVFQRRETKTEEKALPPDVLKAISEEIAAINQLLKGLRKSLEALDQIEKALKREVAPIIAASGSVDNVVVNIRELAGLLNEDGAVDLEELLATPRVYDALSAHNQACRSLLSTIRGGAEDIERKFAEARTAPVTMPTRIQRSSSRDDLAHVAKVEGKASDISFESIASNLTLMRYRMERLAASNPKAYEALMTAWDLRVKATLAAGAVAAVSSAIETGGASLAAYGASLGTGLGLDYLADFVAKYGAEIAAANAATGDFRLYASYKKTFDFAAAMVAQHGIRAGVRKFSAARADVARPAAAPKPVVVDIPGPAAAKRAPAAAMPAHVQDRLFWGSWNDYPKVAQGGREYARIGDRLYTEHAVSRMQPSPLGRSVSTTGANTKVGTSMSPAFVEHVITHGTRTTEIENVRGRGNIERTIFTLGDSKVVTERSGKLVVTISPYSGG